MTTLTKAQIEAIVKEEQDRDDAQVERYILMAHATIERCARLAESMGNLSVSRKDTICREIAAAVRKLKE